MRFILLTLLTILGFEMSPASAQLTTQFPFCIQGVDNPGWSGCSFSTFQECQATASGTESECLSNPWYKSGVTELRLRVECSQSRLRLEPK